jgi:hypothetical protein
MVRWRRAAVFVCWLIAAGWGLYYLIAVAPTSVPFVGVAVLHFIIGYVWGKGVMAQPMTIRVGLLGIFLAGAFTRMAVGVGTSETYFVWAGPLAAAALSDSTSPRNVLYSGAAFVSGLLLMSLAYLNP